MGGRKGSFRRETEVAAAKQQVCTIDFLMAHSLKNLVINRSL